MLCYVCFLSECTAKYVLNMNRTVCVDLRIYSSILVTEMVKYFICCARSVPKENKRYLIVFL